MKKLIALSVALLSVSLYGADKPPTYSPNGLEEIAKDGLLIAVGNPQSDSSYSKTDKTFDKIAIENQVKLRLRQS